VTPGDASAAPAAAAASLEVGIVVHDLEAATPFYRDGLGLRHVADLPLPVGLQRRFACGGGIVKLMQLNEPPTRSNPPGGIMGGTTGLRWFSFRVSGIERVIERCLAVGGTVASPLVEWQPGMKVVVLQDSAGSCWVELSERSAE
jgi:catechol 2,3-dioxygenase-like lactoylglutathione lyase family enzyme